MNANEEYIREKHLKIQERLQKKRRKLIAAFQKKLSKMEDQIIQLAEGLPGEMFDERDKDRLISLADDIGNAVEWFAGSGY